jgi:serine protease Do
MAHELRHESVWSIRGSKNTAGMPMERLRLIRTGHFWLGLSFLVFLIASGVTIHDAAVRAPTHPSKGAHPSVQLPDFVALADRFAPSLVHISTVYGQRGKTAASSSFQSDAPSANPGAPGGLGSGIIINRGGHIVTNYHVIDQADKIFVKLADRRTFEAAVAGRDLRSDIAVLKITPQHALQAAPMGDSSQLETGEWVLAMGSPFGLDRSVTAGIISAKARRMPASAYYDYIQTDLTINPGNSGGPLLSLQGQVVGINTAMLSRKGVSVGINFAIPINPVKDLLPELLARGHVTRGWLGVSTQIMTPAAARRLNFDQTGGALIVAVDVHGPAAHAGIHAGDIVTRYDGTSISEAGDLPALVAKTAVGQEVLLEIRRNRILYQTVVRVGELKEPPPLTGQASVAGSSSTPRGSGANELGANFAIIDASAAMTNGTSDLGLHPADC